MAGFDRDRSFYPTVLIVIALFYILFAVMGGSPSALIAEMIPVTLFVALAIAGFKINAWLVVGGLAAHGVFDFFHSRLITNPGVPLWWPSLCLAYDIALAVLLAMMLRGERQTTAVR